MSDTGRDEPVTRYLMYKASLQDGDVELGERSAQRDNKSC
jgi:hypothetical protein